MILALFRINQDSIFFQERSWLARARAEQKATGVGRQLPTPVLSTAARTDRRPVREGVTHHRFPAFPTPPKGTSRPAHSYE